MRVSTIVNKQSRLQKPGHRFSMSKQSPFHDRKIVPPTINVAYDPRNSAAQNSEATRLTGNTMAMDIVEEDPKLLTKEIQKINSE